MTRDYSLSGDLSLWGQFTLTLSDRPISTYSRTLMCINQRQASHCEVEPPITYRRHVTDTDITIFSNSRHATDTDNDFLVRCRHGTDTDSQTFKNCRHVCRHRQTADNLVCLTLGAIVYISHKTVYFLRTIYFFSERYIFPPNSPYLWKIGQY